jgi:hypothetical protein
MRILSGDQNPVVSDLNNYSKPRDSIEHPAARQLYLIAPKTEINNVQDSRLTGFRLATKNIE